MDRPSPIPVRFVLKNESKSFDKSPSANPGPWSFTETIGSRGAFDLNQNRAPVERRVGQGVHRIHDQIDHDLLDLCLVPEDARRCCRRSKRKRHVSPLEFRPEEGLHVGQYCIQIERLPPGFVPGKQSAQALDDFAGAQIVISDAADEAQQVFAPITSGLKNHFGGVGVGLHGAERLIDLMCDGRGKFAGDGKT